MVSSSKMILTMYKIVLTFVNIYYYYDSNDNYKCTNENSCLAEYLKLISKKKRYIDNSRNYNKYQYEYNNNYILVCPSRTHRKSDEPYVCEGDLNL